MFPNHLKNRYRLLRNRFGFYSIRPAIGPKLKCALIALALVVALLYYVNFRLANIFSFTSKNDLILQENQYYIDFLDYQNSLKKNSYDFIVKNRNYSIELAKERIDSLFDRLGSFEATYGDAFDRMGLFQFKNLIDVQTASELNVDRRFILKNRDQFEKYFYVENTPPDLVKHVYVRPAFVDYLKNKSDFYSFKSPRNMIRPHGLEDVISFLKKSD